MYGYCVTFNIAENVSLQEKYPELDQALDAVTEAVISKGKSFVLFSSRKPREKIADLVRKHLDTETDAAVISHMNGSRSIIIGTRRDNDVYALE